MEVVKGCFFLIVLIRMLVWVMCLFIMVWVVCRNMIVIIEFVMILVIFCIGELKKVWLIMFE